MKESSYRDALVFGWQFTKKHKFLWVYGLFAAVLGQMGIFDILAKISSAIFKTGVAEPQTFRQFYAFLAWHPSWDSFFSENGSDWFWLFWVVLVCIGLFVFFVVISLISQGALIHAAAQANGGKGTVAKDSREWHAGVSHFWRLFFLNALKRIVIAYGAFLAGWSAYTALLSGKGTDLLFFLGVFLFAATLGLISSFLVIYAAGYVVVEEYPLFEAIHAAWRLFLAHWLVSFEVGVIFFVLNLFLGFFGALLFLVLLLPIAVVWFFALLIGSQFLFALVVAFFFLCFVAGVLLMASFFTVFSTTVWTHLFMHMHRYGMKSRVLHWLSYAE